MGNPVVDLVMEQLRTGNFAVGEAGAGGKAPALTGPGAAVWVHSADWHKMTVTLGIHILCPEALGAVRCQSEALRAGEILNQAGIRCTQGRCSYDGLSRMYSVELLAELTGTFQGEEFLPGPGFSVSLGDTPLPWAVSFKAELSREIQAQYELGNGDPVGLVPGEQSWKVELTELIPPGVEESREEPEVFDLVLNRCGLEERFLDCRWRSQRREYTSRGLQRVRIGICTHREVTSHE